MNAKSFAVPAMILGLAAGTTGAATAVQSAVPAESKSKSTVTIQARGTHLSGKIMSPRKAKCASGRAITIVMQMGARGNDMAMGRVAANRQGSWSATPGMAGKYYAVAKATRACKRDASVTVRTTG